MNLELCNIIDNLRNNGVKTPIVLVICRVYAEYMQSSISLWWQRHV